MRLTKMLVIFVAVLWFSIGFAVANFTCGQCIFTVTKTDDTSNQS